MRKILPLEEAAARLHARPVNSSDNDNVLIEKSEEPTSEDVRETGIVSMKKAEEDESLMETGNGHETGDLTQMFH